jgi:hypothetical protein
MAEVSNRTGAHPASPPTDDRRDERHDVVVEDSAAREKFGGLNVGAGFFGWLVAIAITVLMISVVGAAMAAIGSTTSVTQSDAERSAGTIGMVAGGVLIVVLAVSYFVGGYVAGRMSRYDGARQGLGVWVIGLVVTLVALALGAIFGSQYNILDRVDLPRIPISTDQLGWGGIVTAALVLILTLAGAALGGVVGHRYHDRVDRAARR